MSLLLVILLIVGLVVFLLAPGKASTIGLVCFAVALLLLLQHFPIEGVRFR